MRASKQKTGETREEPKKMKENQKHLQGTSAPEVGLIKKKKESRYPLRWRDNKESKTHVQSPITKKKKQNPAFFRIQNNRPLARRRLGKRPGRLLSDFLVFIAYSSFLPFARCPLLFTSYRAIAWGNGSFALPYFCDGFRHFSEYVRWLSQLDAVAVGALVEGRVERCVFGGRCNRWVDDVVGWFQRPRPRFLWHPDQTKCVLKTHWRPRVCV